MSASGNSAPASPESTAKSRNWRAKYGPWAVVTGASDGIGRAIAISVAEAGLNLVMVARRRDALETLAAELAQAHHIQTKIVAVDLGQRAAVDEVILSAQGIEVGLLAAVAGFGTSGPFTENPIDGELEMIDVNCSAVVELSHHFAQRFAAQRRGGLVLMSSLLAFQGVPRAATYAATKAFIQTFAEGLGLELSGTGVDVVASAPGPVRSGFEARANMRMSAGASPAVVARGTLDALGRRTTVRPGFLSKFLETSLLPLPRLARSRIMSVVMGSMTRHQDDGKKRQDARFA